MQKGEIQLAEKYITESISLSRQSNYKAGLMYSLDVDARIAFSRGDFEQAYAIIQESIAFSQEIGNRNSYLWSRSQLGYIRLRQGDLIEGARHFF